MRFALFRLSVSILLLILAFIAYGAWYRDVSSMSDEVATLANQIAIKNQTASRIATAQAALTEIAGDESVVQAYFLSQNNIVTFIDGLESLARTQGGALTVLSVSSAAAQGQGMFTIALSVKGSFDAVMRTLGAIEASPTDLTMSAVSLGLDAKNSWHGNATIMVGMSASATTTPATTP